MKQQRRTFDLAGKQFNYLTVLSRSESRRRGQAWWNCRCKCDEITLVNSSDLISGRRKQCRKCFSKSVSERRRNRLPELTGLRFSKLVVLGRQKTVGFSKYECQCDCGNKKFVSAYELINKGTQSCGCWRHEFQKKRTGENHPNWKGGYKTRNGYVEILNPQHPNAGKRGYVKEHTAVMSSHLGRPLLPDDTVHHKNGIRHDNRLENLELWASKHPSGQRVEDLIIFAEEILKRYK
jgi:hypothetical protein